jgi:hypothetical protein
MRRREFIAGLGGAAATQKMGVTLKHRGSPENGRSR